MLILTTRNRIMVTIDPEKGEISVLNNGRGIPIEMHKKEKMYIPSMIFGVLLTSDNYDDNRKKVTGGRNGFGAKLCNIFSSKFTVETVDSSRKLKFKQTWRSVCCALWHTSADDTNLLTLCNVLQQKYDAKK